MKTGWRTALLEDLTQQDSPITYGVVKPGDTGDVPFVRGGDIADGLIYEERLRTITTEVSQQYKRTLLRGGELLISLVGQPGQVAVAMPTLAGANIARQVGLIRLQAGLDAEFACYFLRSPDGIDALGKFTGGSVQQVINLSDLRRVEVPVPPLPEQQRIVTLLDEAFDGIATAKANAEKNVQNARAIFESHLQSVFTQGGEGWTKTTLGKATGGVFTGPFGSLLHKSEYVKNGIPLVNPAHITDIGIEPDLHKTVSEATAQKLSSYIMRKGDVVIGRRGEMGRCALVTDVEDGWLCGTGSFYIKQSPRCDSGYLVRYLRSDACKQRLEKIAGGAVMPNLSNTDLSNLSFDLPSVEMQKAIGNQIDDFATETQRLETIYQQKLTALDELKKSLLHRAFNGDM
jgi:type I restriction enzyme S subunit